MIRIVVIAISVFTFSCSASAEVSKSDAARYMDALRRVDGSARQLIESGSVGVDDQINIGAEWTTPLVAAVIFGDRLTVDKLLTSGAKLDRTDKYNRTPILKAVDQNDVQLLRVLLNGSRASPAINIQESEFGNTPLHMALTWNSVEMVRMLIEAGAREDIPNRAGDTAAILCEKFKLVPCALLRRR